MGEAKINAARVASTLANLLATEPRCIYCQDRPATIEHMPPIAMFIGRQRPKGLEFAACSRCNNGTGAADLVASYVARISPDAAVGDTLITEAIYRHRVLDTMAPGFRAEFSDPANRSEVWLRSPGGVLQRKTVIQADGPLMRQYLTVFSAKLAMAMFRNHAGAALPLDGGVETYHFLNAGLAQGMADAWLNMLPVLDTIRQGKLSVADQFVYRWNSDDRELVAIFAQFHRGLFIGAIAASTPEKWGLPSGIAHSSFARPGDLVGMMPS